MKYYKNNEIEFNVEDCGFGGFMAGSWRVYFFVSTKQEPALRICRTNRHIPKTCRKKAKFSTYPYGPDRVLSAIVRNVSAINALNRTLILGICKNPMQNYRYSVLEALSFFCPLLSAMIIKSLRVLPDRL